MKLLAMSDPFTAPTDRDMMPSERREFVRTHRTCVYGYERRFDGPAMSVVYYVPTDTGELLVSTMAARGKAKAAERLGLASLCVLDERWPFAYLQVYCHVVVDRDPDLTVDLMMAVGERMSGQPLGEHARPFVQAMAAEEGRLVLRCRPHASFAQAPQHFYRNDQQERLTHRISAALPWDASDPS
jgi:hypothetical protein